VQHLVALTDGGADYSFECVGNVDLMRQALECCHRGWGVSVIIGCRRCRPGDPDTTFPARHRARLEGHGLRGARGRTDVPRIVTGTLTSRIQTRVRSSTHVMPLDRINEAFDLMHSRVHPQRRDVTVTCSKSFRTPLLRRRAGVLSPRTRRMSLADALLAVPATCCRARAVRVLYYLAGLTCTEGAFMTKAGAQRTAAELG